ncbi:glutaredoxin family protein [Alkalinema pantanalense CENA528]|uniref:glutaredoxin family protein n=1 Tax=Alkalinema pantanalense TaxID=1620705 RepID=UPI003D6F0A17
MHHLILYSKPGCHLCEGLEEKLRSIVNLPLQLEIRDITSRDDWFQAYQYEIPVLHWLQGETAIPLPRLSPRASVAQVEQMLQKYTSSNC